MSDIEEYVRDVMRGATHTISHWMKKYLKLLLTELLQEGIVIRYVNSSFMRSPGIDRKGAFTITVTCFDDDMEYVATATWKYRYAVMSAPDECHWELQEIELEEIQ